LDYIYEHLGELDKNKHYYVHCAGGYRSMIACSILKRNGFEAITDIAGGFNAIKNTSMPLTQEICPTTGQPK
jgi:rhodanese-related sulfurtransferase